ncbi:bifunctional diguanylate cyclase/phosphodiesterase [Hahella ganghwensis]|uniref:bifunctional diguanylate cyclase/phosphodiesterase n=1 Tax=Hahella ganghwensis TaxID=286420 RepID=UPI0003AA61FB|nr:EAL domain-containing protein [Hahella ganghwensis]
MGRYFIQFVLLVIAYHLGTHLGLFVKVLYGDVSPLWPPAGLALAMVWYSGWRWAPVILVGELLAALVLDQPYWTGITGGIGMMAEVVVAMMLIHLNRIDKDFKTSGQVLRFFAIVCLVAPLASAAVGIAGLLLSGLVSVGDSGPVWITWWLGDAVGLMLITPLIWFWWYKRPSSPDLFLGWMSLTCLLVAFFIFAYLWFPGRGWMFFFLLLPYVVFSSIRMGKHGASLSLVLMAVLVLGEGWEGDTADFLLSIKMAFVGTCCLTGYALAVMMEANVEVAETLHKKKWRLQTTLQSISDGVVKVDDYGAVVFSNVMADKILGASENQMEGHNFDRYFKFTSLDNPGKKIRPVEKYQMVAKRNELTLLCQLDRESSRPSVLEMRICPVLTDEGDSVGGAVIVLRDVTADIEVRRLLEFQSTHDPLTDLPNRRALDEALKAVIEELREPEGMLAEGPRSQGALMYIDLDQFKLINDTCGHEVGDLMLKELARELNKIIGGNGLLARIGGDEFAFLLERCTESEAENLATEIHRVISDFQFRYEDLSFSLGCSIGLTYFTREDYSQQAVLSRADIACYKAKEKGRNRISVFRAKDAEMLRYKGELEWISQIKSAISSGSFRLYQQGIFDLKSDGSIDSTFGLEVLIRLEQRDQVVAPGSFIPIAERFGYMPVIDRWVTETLFRKICLLPPSSQVYYINLSGATFNDEYFFDDVENWAASYNINRNLICFEVTESVALQDINRTREIIQHFKSLGYRFALDDFGSGTASYAYLSQLPVDYVKLDGKFVRTILHDPIAKVVIDSLVQIARLKGMTCIAECVEYEEEARMLVELGINLLQGYYYEKPFPMPKS